MNRRLLIDCTATYFSVFNTGIQRTTKKIIENKNLFKSFDEVYSVVQFGESYYLVDLENNGIFRLTKFLHKCGSKLRNFLDYLFNKRQIDVIKNFTNDHKSTKRTFRDDKFSKLYEKILYFCRAVLYNLLKLTKKIDSLFVRNKKITFNDSDVLFIPDSFWDPSFSIELIKKIKRIRRIKIILFVHDTFPFTYSYVLDTNNVIQYKKNFYELADLLDGYICNSDFTLLQLNDLLKKNFQQYAHLPKEYVLLGMDFQKNMVEGTKNEYNIHKLYNEENIYLMVGTIEPRKNHLYVLNVFDKLWDYGYTNKLVIIGRIGWKCNEIVNKIKNSKYYGKYLFMFNKTSDSELIDLYNKSKAVIVASIVEGYGLPLVEAINFNKPVFASDIPIFREVGENYPIYFDLNNIDSLYNKILLFEEGKISCGEKPNIPTWEECVKNLNSVLYEMVAK